MYMVCQQTNHLEPKQSYLNVRTQFESLAQMINELRPNKPNTMNLKKVGWKTGL